MNQLHIINLLDEKGYRGFSVQELAAAESHALQCRDCARALRAARVAEELLDARVSFHFDPQPFFTKRVMAEIRGKQSQPEPPLFFRLWHASRFLVSAMLAVVMILFALNWHAVEAPTMNIDNVATARNMDTSDIFLMYDQDSSAEDNLTDSQVLSAVFGSGDNYGNEKQK